MRFGGRLQAAIEVLGDIEQRRRTAADALKDWGLSHRFAGSGDRAAIGNLVYDTLRWRASSAWLADSETAHAGVLAMVRHRWRLSEGELETRLANDPHAPEPLAPSDLKAIATRDLALAPDHIRADVPEWLATHLEQAFGVDWLGEGAASAKRPPLDLRVNTLKADRGKVARAPGQVRCRRDRPCPAGAEDPADHRPGPPSQSSGRAIVSQGVVRDPG